MCTNRILASGNQGYVVRCQQCNHFQIAFGTVVIRFCAMEYEKFKLQLEDQFHLFNDHAFPEQKMIELPTFNTNTKLILNFFELENLMKLVTEANILDEAEIILQKINK